MFGCAARQSQLLRKLVQCATKNNAQRNISSLINLQGRNISRKADPNCRAALFNTTYSKDSNTSIISHNTILKSYKQRSYATKAPSGGVEVTDLPPLMVPPMPADPTQTAANNMTIPQELLSDADILVPITGPVSLFENIFQIIHVDFGLPWWASFAAVTITLRTAALYVVVPQIRHAALMSCIQPRMSRLIRNIVTAWRQKNYIGRDMYLRSLKMLWTSQGVHPARNFVSLLFNIPLFGVYFMAIRDMVKVFPSLASESVLWLDSLAQADPLHVLPFVWSGLLLISFELAIRNAAPGKILQVISWFTRAVCLLAIVFSWNVPAAMFFCWIPSTFFAMLQNYFLTQNRTVRRWFGIPNLPLDRAEITKALNKQAIVPKSDEGSQPNPLSALKGQLPQ